MHHNRGQEARGDVNGVLNPEDRDVQNHIPHGTTSDPRDDGKPHEPHHVHALTRRDERPGDGERDGRKNVEEVN